MEDSNKKVDLFAILKSRYAPVMELMETKKKLVIVGDGDTGKTSLLIVFCRGEFPRDTLPTTFDIFTKDMEVDGETLTLGLWDTGGQEVFERLRPLSYLDANVILMCFCVDQPTSFGNILDIWLPEIRYYCPNVPVVLVGNKKDLRNDKDVVDKLARVKLKPVSREEGEEMKCKIKAYAYVECSSLTQDNVYNVFNTACKAMVDADKRRVCKCCEKCCAKYCCTCCVKCGEKCCNCFCACTII